jgi:hypothetical protein
MTNKNKKTSIQLIFFNIIMKKHSKNDLEHFWPKWHVNQQNNKAD